MAEVCQLGQGVLSLSVSSVNMTDRCVKKKAVYLRIFASQTRDAYLHKAWKHFWMSHGKFVTFQMFSGLVICTGECNAEISI